MPDYITIQHITIPSIQNNKFKKVPMSNRTERILAMKIGGNTNDIWNDIWQYPLRDKYPLHHPWTLTLLHYDNHDITNKYILMIIEITCCNWQLVLFKISTCGAGDADPFRNTWSHPDGSSHSLLAMGSQCHLFLWHYVSQVKYLLKIV